MSKSELGPLLDMNASTGASTSETHTGNKAATIQSGHTVLLKLPNGDIRSVKVEKDSYACS